RQVFRQHQGGAGQYQRPRRFESELPNHRQRLRRLPSDFPDKVELRRQGATEGGSSGQAAALCVCKRPVACASPIGIATRVNLARRIPSCLEDGVCANDAAIRPANVYRVAITRERNRVRRLRTALSIIAACAIFALAALWILTLPAVVPASALPPRTPNLANGESMFNIGGCSSCHAVPNDSPAKVDPKRLGGGLALKSPFGTFYAPNISPDPKDGIGNWSEANFVTALWKGTSDRGTNLYPAFPYTSYHYMRLDDVRDLFAYLKTLPPVQARSRRHELSFPFNERRLLGAW